MPDSNSTLPADPTAVPGHASAQTAGVRRSGSGAFLMMEGRAITRASTSRGWAHFTGLVALRQCWAWLAVLVGVRRTSRLVFRGESVSVTERLSIFGATVHEEEQNIPASRIVSVRSVRALPSLPVMAGAAILIVALAWGALRIVEGIVGGGAKTVLLGLAVLAIGAVADVLLFLVTQNLFRPGRFGVSVHLVDGRSVGVWGVPEETARRALESFPAKDGP